MKKIIPFKKDIIFDNDIFEITSISLDHSLKQEDRIIKGEFTISGDYKTSEINMNKEEFLYNLPVTINIDDKYENNEVTFDIDDFYYEITDDKVLSISIDLLIDNLNERCIEEEITTTIEEKNITNESTIIEEEKIEKENYNSYIVHIIRDGESLETILEKYQKTKEEIEDYNDLTEIKIGDKIIIPC